MNLNENKINSILDQKTKNNYKTDSMETKPLPSLPSNPFEGLKISNFDPLDLITQRSPCQQCGKSRMYYCYDCCLPLSTTQSLFPKIKLPFHVIIIKHPGELPGKSTSIHCTLISSSSSSLYLYPSIPQNITKEDTLLLYPSSSSVSLEEWLKAGNEENKKKLKNVIFIDSTWFQASGILSDPRLRDFPRIELKKQETKFWRPQLNKPSTYLSTIETIYYFTKEYQNLINKKENFNYNLKSKNNRKRIDNFDFDNNYDNLLFLFAFMYRKIRKTAEKEGRILKSYTCERKRKK